jgi:carboxymethylenebutenolidase
MNIFQNYLAEEFIEDYQEGRISRRQALKLIASVTGSLVLASSLLAACAPLDPAGTSPAPSGAGESPAQPSATSEPASNPTGTSTAEPEPAATAAQESPAAAMSEGLVNATVSPDDPEVQAGAIQFAGEDTELMGYLARPAAEGAFPVVLVCHENRGLTDHIRDVTRRLAKAGYVALAVDLLSRQGGTSAVGSDQVPGALVNMPPEQYVQDFRSGWLYLRNQAYAQSERLGMVGFCFGGGVTWLMATRMPELKAAVPYYGPHPSLADVPNIQAAVLAIYGELDQRINQGIPDIEAAMQEHNKIFEKMIYPNADHAFNNDTSSRYNPEAAQAAWQRTLEWFGTYL